MGSKDSGQSATQITELPEWAQPYAKGLLTAGAEAANQPYQQYQGMTIAPMNEAQKTALGLTAGTAIGGNPATNAALGQLASTSAGGQSNPWATEYNPYMMTGNPQLQAMIDQSNQGITGNYAKTIAPGTNAMFARSGAFGGSSYLDKVGQDQATLSQTLANNENTYRFQDYAQKANLTENALTRGNADYEAERGRQMQAAQMGLQGDAIDFNRAKNLAGAGDAAQMETQKLLDAQKAEWDRQQNYPWSQIDKLGAVLGKSLGGSSSTTSTMPGPTFNPIAGMIGGGVAGYGAGQLLGASNPLSQYLPWLGAGLGGLGG